MKIRDLKNDKDIQMVYDANASIRGTIWYIVSCRETDNINEFLDKFEGTFHYENFVYGSEEPRVSMAGHGDIQQVIEIIEDLDEIDTYLPPEINLHKILELSNKFMNTDDSDEGIALSDDCLGQIFDEVENGFKRFWNRVESRNFLISSFKEFIELQADCIENILDKEIDDDFYIIEEEPQTPKMRKYLDASKEDRDKIWERNPKFREEVRKEVIADKQDFLNDTTFSLIKGATTYIDIEKNICLIEVYNDKMFVHSLLNILNTSALDFNSELETTFDKIRNEGYNPTNDDVAKLIGSLKMTVEIAHQSTQNMDEIREYHEDIILDTLEEDSLVYDDNFILYKSFA